MNGRWLQRSDAVFTTRTTDSGAPGKAAASEKSARSRRRSRAWWVFGSAVAVAAIGLIIVTAVSFKAGNHAVTASGNAELHDGIRVYAKVLKLMPAEGHMVIEMAFQPVGSYEEGEHFLARPVRVEATGGADALDLRFDRGAVMAPANLHAALGNGDISDYPFDSYQTIVHVHVMTADGAAVPSVLFAEALVHGYRVTLVEPQSQPNGSNEMTIEIKRAPATLVFALFVMFLMWALTVLSLALAVKEIRSGRRVDVELIALFGVLLFAFPAVRTTVPNAPELGVLGDFLAYFWCEIALGLGLVALLATNVFRRPN
ncbi:DUF4436 domain-containing protein [Mycolicibacterium moriokaense]|nr:DUF4436 domain-containing protein [Mycolicibacterium moriokaense]